MPSKTDLSKDQAKAEVTTELSKPGVKKVTVKRQDGDKWTVTSE